MALSKAMTRWTATTSVAILLALMALLAPAVARSSGVPIPDNAAALAATTCSQQLYIYKGSNGSGGGRALCAEDYPLVRTPPTANGNFAGWDWPDGTHMDNSASSYAWASTTTPGFKIKFLSGYNWAGYEYIVTRPSVGSGPYNFPSNWNNVISSFGGCGTSCSDEP